MTEQARPNTRFHGDRGSVLVEAAFIFPIVFFICMAIFEYGLLFAAQSTTQSATRDGARFASANFAVAGRNQAAADQVMGAVSQDLSARTGFDTPIQMLVYKADANGDPTRLAEQLHGRLLPLHVDRQAASSTTRPAHTRGRTRRPACRAPIDTIGVYVQMQHNYITNTFGSSQTISEHTVSRLEPLPANQCS